MANFLAVLDPDASRRRAFLEAIEPRIAPLPGLVTQHREAGDCAVVWAAGAQAPLSVAEQDGGVAVLWGDALEGGRRVTAGELAAAWRGSGGQTPQPMDGFHAAVVHHPRLGLLASADLLGLFPLYYFSADTVRLVGSSPELFFTHPVCKGQLDYGGLAGILLTNGLVAGRTLWAGVRRLGAGKALIAPPGEDWRELVQYELPASDRYFSYPLSAHADLLDRAVSEALARAVPPTRACGLLLSGGIDSRHLAGTLARLGRRPEALTFGDRDDVEARCAAPVARALRLEHRILPVREEHYDSGAALAARWEHLSCGFSSPMMWGLCAQHTDLPAAMVAGYALDGAIGPNTVKWPYSPEDHTLSFSRLFARVNAWGIQHETLRRLLPRPHAGLVDEVVSQLQEEYRQGAMLESQRAWRLGLRHRHRFHVGGAAWQLSFRFWPVLPVLDQGVLAVAGGLPAASLADRMAQKKLVCERFSGLAALPLDRNSYDTKPLQPKLRYLLGRYPMNLLRAVLRTDGRRGRERRYYFRTYDFNGPGWRRVRRLVEPLRRHLDPLFEPEVLRGVLPGTAEYPAYRDGIVESAGPKLLVGLSLLLGEHPI